jgi:hypothetical protein
MGGNTGWMAGSGEKQRETRRHVMEHRLLTIGFLP